MKDKPGKHSFVHDIRIATPCTADWNKMSGDERSRHCQQCKLNVYNISDMTSEEAETLIKGAEGGRVCVRLYRRKDGTVITRDCPVAVWKVKKMMITAWGVVTAIVGAGAWWVFGRSEPQGVIMGAVAPMPMQKLQPPQVELNTTSTPAPADAQPNEPAHVRTFNPPQEFEIIDSPTTSPKRGLGR